LNIYSRKREEGGREEKGQLFKKVHLEREEQNRPKGKKEARRSKFDQQRRMGKKGKKL